MLPGGLLRPIGALWALLSMLVGTTCLFSFVQPAWITVVRHSSQNNVKLSFGLICHCEQHLPDGQTFCRTYGDFGNMFRDLPSTWIGFALLFFGIGSNSMFFSGLASLPTICCRQNLHVRFVRAVARFQAIAVIFMTIGLLLVPVQFNSSSLKCGADSGFYRLGRCHMGWSYCLAIVSTLLAVCCPLLAQNTTFILGPEPDLAHEQLTLKFPREFYL